MFGKWLALAAAVFALAIADTELYQEDDELTLTPKARLDSFYSSIELSF